MSPSKWQQHKWHHRWHHLSIRNRVLLATIVPVLYLFCSVVGYSYQSRQQETHAELNERAHIVATALAESLAANVVNRNIAGLYQSMNALVQSDRSIQRIAVFDAQHQEMTHVTSLAANQAQESFVEMPIQKKLIWVSLLPQGGQEGQTNAASARTGEVGFVRVTMSPTSMQAKQLQRFYIELAMAAIGLAVSIVLARRLAKGLSEPLNVAAQALRAIRGGDYAAQVEVDTGGEIGELQTSINRMADSLRLAKEELEAKVAARTRDLEASRNEAVKADAEKRRLIQKVHSIVEQERKSIAIEIHDELNAALIAARLDAQRISQLAGKLEASSEQAEINAKALAITQVTRDLYANGRSLVRRLRPEVLDMLGLPGAVEEMLKHYNDVADGCHFGLDYSGDFSALDAEVAISAYRIVQEALSNIIKHANAQHAQLSLHASAGALHMVVEDDGVGFDASQSSDGIGLTGMRERVYAFHGDFAITPCQPHGVRIAIRLPWHQSAISNAAGANGS